LSIIEILNLNNFMMQLISEYHVSKSFPYIQLVKSHNNWP
jgi:hypothetical protein